MLCRKYVPEAEVKGLEKYETHLLVMRDRGGWGLQHHKNSSGEGIEVRSLDGGSY